MALIGYISSAFEDKCHYTDNYLGGLLISFPFITVSPESIIICKSCQTPKKFFLQIYCPLEASIYHRSLYIFVCLKFSCQLSGKNWSVLRSQCLDSSSTIDSKLTSWNIADNTNEHAELDDWGSVDFEDTQINPTIAESSPQEFRIGGTFQCRAIDIYEDTNEYQKNSDLFNPAATIDEAIEEAFVEEDDNTIPGAFSGLLQIHLERRSEYGCEDIRYSWNGVPICNGTFPRELLNQLICSRCGSKRIFEVQLFPTINNSLKIVDHTLTEELNDDGDDNIDAKFDSSWLLRMTTLLVFTCSSSCWSPGDNWAEECVVVQLDDKFIIN